MSGHQGTNDEPRSGGCGFTERLCTTESSSGSCTAHETRARLELGIRAKVPTFEEALTLLAQLAYSRTSYHSKSLKVNWLPQLQGLTLASPS